MNVIETASLNGEENTMLSNINNLSLMDILSDALFDELFSVHNEGERGVCIVELKRRAKELGCALEFKSRLASVNADFKKYVQERTREDNITRFRNDREKYEPFTKFNAIGEPIDTDDIAIVDHIIENKNLFVMYGKLYWYDGGVYMLDASDKYCFSVLRTEYVIHELVDINRFKKICELLKCDIRLHRSSAADIWKHPRSWVNFKNGFVDLRTLELIPHEPKYCSISQIPWNYIEGEPAENSISKKFLEGFIRDEEDRKMFLEYVGYCLTIDRSMQRFLILKGQGGIGKSVLIKMVQWLVGNDCNKVCSIHAIGQRFKSTSLLGKTLVSYPDISAETITDSSVLKMITGGDTIDAEYKFGDSFDFEPTCKLLFSANRIPKFKDDNTNAMYRRMMILELKEKGAHIDNLEDGLQADTEAFLQMVVLAAHEAYKRGSLFESEHSKAQVKIQRQDNDSVYDFLAMRCVLDVTAVTRQAELYEAYEDYCREIDVIPKQRKSFYANLRDNGFMETKHGFPEFKGIRLGFIRADAISSPFD